MIDKIEDFGLMILEKIKLKKLADWYREHREGMRYLIFGALTTIVNILTYALLASVILKQIPSKEVVVNVSEIIAFIVALIFAYVTNKIYVFKSKTKGFKELITVSMPVFYGLILAYLLSFIMNFVEEKWLVPLCKPLKVKVTPKSVAKIGFYPLRLL